MGAALGLAIVVALSAVSVSAYVSASNWVDHTFEVRTSVSDWLAAVLDAETGARGYIATGRVSFLEPYESGITRARVQAALLRRLVADNVDQLRNVDEGVRDAQEALDDLSQLVALIKANEREEAISQLGSGESKRRMDRVRADASAIRTEEDVLLVARRSEVASRGWTALMGAVLFTFASSAILIVAWRRERLHDRRVTTLARDARQRLNAISALAEALSETRSRSQVAEVITDHGLRVAGADICTLYELDKTGTTLELIGERGVAKQVLHGIRQISATSANSETFARMKAGTATWVEDEVEYAKLYPTLATLKAEGPRAKAFWSVPLVAEAGTLGLLGVGFYEPKTFSLDEKAFVETLCKQCAQALLRASRLAGEDEARTWLATTLRSIGDAVIATDAEGRVAFINQVAERLTGWTERDARGRPLEDVFCIFSEQTGALVESPVTKVLRAGTVVGLANHTLLRSKLGVEIPIDDSGAPIRDEEGGIVGVVLVFRDATREKCERARNEFLARAGEALVASRDYEATLATVAGFAVPTLADWCSVELVDSSERGSRQVAVAHVDPSKVQFARALGERYPPNPHATTGVPQVIRSGKSELYSEIPQALLEAGAQDADHLRILRDLQLQSALVVPLRVRDRTFGALTFIYAASGRHYNENDLIFAEDFARRAALAIENALSLKELEEARAKERLLRTEAELANRAKDEFLATVSHELRTPLNAILGWTVTLRRRKLADDVDRALAIVERNARAQTKLIEDVLDISRIISGKLSLNLGPANVANVVTSAVETLTPAAEAKEITISSVVPDDLPTITADADRLQQIVWNLLSNAVKFTPKRRHVRVVASREDSVVRISVIDSGEGIRREVLPLVFEPFQQADASITRRHGGLGLGLAIVKQLATAHGGSVRAESEGVGRGATFVVTLPVRLTVPVLSQAASSTTLRRSVTNGAEVAPRLDGLRLLVVDDEEDARGFLSHLLREQGAEIHVAASAREALEKLGTVRPDVIVSDIGMPELDGLSFIKAIRALPLQQGGGTPAIALTAYAREEDAQSALAAGYQMHLAKPVEPFQLTTIIASVARQPLGTSEPTLADASDAAARS